MFALIAFIVFLLALFSVTLGSINMLLLGLAFIALHLFITIPILPSGWRRGRAD